MRTKSALPDQLEGFRSRWETYSSAALGVMMDRLPVQVMAAWRTSEAHARVVAGSTSHGSYEDLFRLT